MRIVSVSGACSRAGKTAVAETLLRSLPPGSAAAVKFTTTEDVFERCPRGSACVVCDIDVPFRIVRDDAVLREPGTDTDRLAAAGASEVFVANRSRRRPAPWKLASVSNFFKRGKTMERDLDRIARKRAGAKLGFYIHAAVFIAVNLALFAINAQVTPSHRWFVWPLGGWGLGLAFHGLGVFLLGSGSGLYERMVQAERRRLE